MVVQNSREVTLNSLYKDPRLGGIYRKSIYRFVKFLEQEGLLERYVESRNSNFKSRTTIKLQNSEKWASAMEQVLQEPKFEQVKTEIYGGKTTELQFLNNLLKKKNRNKLKFIINLFKMYNAGFPGASYQNYISYTGHKISKKAFKRYINELWSEDCPFNLVIPKGGVKSKDKHCDFVNYRGWQTLIRKIYRRFGK